MLPAEASDWVPWSTLPTDSLTLFRIRPGLRLWGKEKPVIVPKETLQEKTRPETAGIRGSFPIEEKLRKKIRVTSPGIELSTPWAAEFPLIKTCALTNWATIYIYIYIYIS